MNLIDAGEESRDVHTSSRAKGNDRLASVYPDDTPSDDSLHRDPVDEDRKEPCLSDALLFTHSTLAFLTPG